MVMATFRFYEELNDFLAPERRRREFTVPCARAATAKHMIEALGVPHTEVELILLNGASVGFGTLLCEGDRVVFYDVHRACGRCYAAEPPTALASYRSTTSY